MAAAVDPNLVEDLATQRTTVYFILDDLISKGNLIASLRKSELEQLDNLLNAFDAKLNAFRMGTRPTTMADFAQPQEPWMAATGVPTEQPKAMGKMSSTSNWEDWTWESALDADQLLNVAEILEAGGLDAFDADFSFG